MSKSIQTIINDTLKKSNILFEKGVIFESVTRIDIMVAMIIDSTKNKLASRNDEVTKYVLEYKEICKYAKLVDEEVKEIYRKYF